MAASFAEVREVECPKCGQAIEALTWRAVDVREREDLRAMFQAADGYHFACPTCGEWVLRDAPMLVVGMAEEAPLLLACPDEILALDDPIAGSEAVLEQVGAALLQAQRSAPGPVLIVPFDVLAMALARDVDGDSVDPAAAAESVAGQFGSRGSERYAIFLADVDATRPARELDAALDALGHVRSEATLDAALQRHPRLLTREARTQTAAIVKRARAAGDDFAVRAMSARLSLLERCAAGDVSAGWAAYEAAVHDLYGAVLDPRVRDLWAEFEAQAGQNPTRAAEIGEQLIATTGELRMTPMEAMASLRTANAYYEADGDRGRNVERSCQLLERAVEILDREPDRVDKHTRIEVLLNLGAAVAARQKGDPAANQERAIRLQREVLELTSKEQDGHSWAMAHTNLGLSLLERERSVDSSRDGAATSSSEGGATLAEAIDHFKQALTWRSFERDPRDWAYTQINLALAYARRLGGDRRAALQHAIDHGTQAIRGFEAAGDVRNRAWALGNRANAETDLAQLEDTDADERTKLLDAAERDAREAISAIGPNARDIDAGRRWRQLAQALAARDGYTPDFVSAARQALESLTSQAVPRECRDTAAHLAELATDAGDWVVAARAWVEAARAGAAAVESRATRSGRLNEIARNGNIFRWAAYALIRTGSPKRAIEMLELGRARELSSWLQHDVIDLRPVLKADPQLCGRFVDLRRRIQTAEFAGDTIENPTVARAVEDLAATVAEIRQLPGLASFLARPQFEDLAGTLPATETIAYPVTSPHGSAWVVLTSHAGRGPEATVVEIPLTSKAVFEVLARLDHEAGIVEGGYLGQQATTGPGLDREIGNASKALGPTLMRPLARALRDADRPSVCIVAIGLLTLVPLHALTWDEGGRPRCLLDEVDVAYSPSAYVRHVCRERAHDRLGFDRLVAVGNPLPNSIPLDDSEYEAAAVAATVPADERVLLCGEAATKEATADALPSASHIHLACHGRAAVHARTFDSALCFDHDRWMSAAEILDLDLSRARLVTASACQTGVVPGYDVLDETLALSTVFLGAGAAGVVASLWSVNDFATSLLMTRFYEELVDTPQGPAGALRRAQLWLRDLSVEEMAAYTVRHPALAEERERLGRDDRRRGRRGSEKDEIDEDDPSTGSAGFAAPTMWAAFVFSGA